MYKFAASDTIFDGVSNIYLISIATAFLAVIVALYCSNFLKDESEKQLKQVLEEVGEEDDDALDEDKDEYLPNDSTSESEFDNHCSIKRQLVEEEDDDENTDDYDCNSEEEENEVIRENYVERNNILRQLHAENQGDEEHYLHVDGLVGKMKSNRVKELEAQLTRNQLEEERRIEREQLTAIFELLKKQEAELNMKEIDENELNAQLSLYR